MRGRFYTLMFLFVFVFPCCDDVSGPPTELTYPGAPYVFDVGKSIASIMPTWTGGEPTSYTISPALPSGLSIDPVTGVLSGKPAYAGSEAQYTITGANTHGSVTTEISITVIGIEWTSVLGAGGTSETYGTGLAMDSFDNLYVTGTTDGEELDKQIVAGRNDMYITRYGADGTRTLTRLFGVAESAMTFGTDLAVDTDDNLYVTGVTNADLNEEKKIGGDVSFIIKYADRGVTEEWMRVIGKKGDYKYVTRAMGIAVDKEANVYAAGYTYYDLDEQTKTGRPDMFVTKYSSDGSRLWTRLLGTKGEDTSGNDVTTDKDGNLYVVGNTNGDFGQTAERNQHGFVIKYSGDGNKLWIKLIDAAAPENTYGNSVVIDKNGDVYVAGETAGDLDGQIKTGKSDMYITKFKNDGSRVWTVLMGTADAYTGAMSIAVDNEENLYITGYASRVPKYGVPTDGKDMIIAKYSSDGERLWSRLVGGEKDEDETQGRRILAGRNGDVYVTGDTTASKLNGKKKSGYVSMFVLKYY